MRALPIPPKISASERWELALIAVVAFLLRAWSLRDQIFNDDEWHALRSAVGESYRKLYLDLAEAATPGLHILFKLMHDTVGLTELRMRLPMLLCGVASVVVFPLVLAPYLDRSGRRIFALLLTVSPLLVYFSRYARPYSISLFCGFVGIVAFLRWWRGEGRGWAVAYCALAVVGVYGHPAFAPTLLVPFPLALIAALVDREEPARRGERIRSLFRLGLATAGGLAVTVGPALVLDWGALAGRLGHRRATLETLANAGELALGTAAPVALGVACLLAVWGVVVLARRHGGLALSFGGVVVAVLLPSLLSTGDSISIPIVFLRYTLWLLPALLMLVALGSADLLGPLERRFGESSGLALAVFATLILFLVGPLPQTLRQPNAWTNHAMFNYTWRDTSRFSYVPNLRPSRLPEFYGELAVRPRESVTLVEAPWFYEWHNNPLPFYQRAHGQRVVAGMLGWFCPQPAAILELPAGSHSLRFRNAVDLTQLDGMRFYDVHYLVLHLDLANEMSRGAFDVQRAPNNNIPASMVEQCLPFLTEVFGPPIHRDPDLVVFDLQPFSGVTRKN